MNSVIKLDHQDIAESSTLRYDITMEDERVAKVWLQTRSIEMDAFRKCPVIVEGDSVVNVVDPEENEYLVNLTCATTEKIAETLSSARKFAYRLNPFPDDRRKCWNRVVKLLEGNVHLLSVLESKSTGRAFRRVRDSSLPKAIEHMQKFASYSELLFDGRNRGSWSPQGVVLVSLPSTSELELLTLKLAPILAAGNAAVVCLEPVATSGNAQCYVNLALLLFAELCTEAGFGDGSLHVAVCQWPLWGMAINDNVDSVVFIGSLEKARLVQAKSAEIAPRPPDMTVTIRRQLVVVVFESADLDSAVEGVVNAMCRVDGSVVAQQQPSVNFRLFVQESVFPRVRDKLRLRLQKLRAGKSLDRNSDYVDTGDCLVRSLLAALVHGDQDCLQFREARGEMLAFRTVKEAVSMVNSTGVSNAAHLWTENMTMAMEASRLVSADFVLINAAYGPWGVAELVQELQPSIANGSVGGIEDLCKHLRFTARWFHVVNPCREIHSSAESLQKCISAAQKAQKEWSSLPPHGRTLRLLDVAYNLERSSESFVKLMKCASKQEEETAMLFAPYCANAVKALAVQTGNLSGVMQEPSAAASATTVLQTSSPIGVVAVACPEVLSITALVKMVAIAVTAGNAVILISSPVRSDAENIVKVFVDSALPRGLVNVVYGCRADVAAHLVAGGVRALWYFGSDQEWARVAAGCDPLRLQCLWRDSELNIDENGVLSNQRCDVFWRCTVAKRVCVPEGDIFAN